MRGLTPFASYQLSATSFQLEVLAGGWRLAAGRPVIARGSNA
jgi:hypothetical protein